MRFWLVLPRPGVRDARHEKRMGKIYPYSYLGRSSYMTSKYTYIYCIRRVKSIYDQWPIHELGHRKWLKDTKKEAKNVRHSANHIHQEVQTDQSKLKVTHGEKKKNLVLTESSDDPIIHNFQFFYLSWQFGEVIICVDCSRSIDRRSFYYPPIFFTLGRFELRPLGMKGARLIKFIFYIFYGFFFF